MLRASVQKLINILLIIILIGSIVFGALTLIPSRNPVGPLLGKIISSKGNLSGLLENLDPVKLAEALRENPNMISDLFAELGEEGAQLIAQQVNEDPEFISALLSELEPATLAVALNDPRSQQFTLALMDYLDPQAIATVVNRSGDFLTALLGYLDPRVVAEAVNANEEFLTSSTGSMDPAVLARAVNENGPFLTALIGFLNPAVLAGSMNVNPTLVADLMGYLDSAVVAQVVNANGSFITRLLRYLKPQVLTAGMNAHPTFLCRIMAHLNPDTIASVLNANADSTSDLVDHLTDNLLLNVLAVTAHDTTWMNRLLSALNPAVLAAAANNASPFTSGLLQVLDPVWVAGVANTHEDLVFKAMDAISPELVATMLNNGTLLTRVLPLVDTVAIGTALGEHADLVTRLLPLLNPAMAEITNEALKTNPGLVRAVLADLNGAQIASALAQAPSFLTGVVKGIAPGTVAAMLRGSNENLDLMINLTNALDAESIAYALDLSGSFVPTLLAFLPNNVAKAAAQALNANPALLDTVLSTAKPKVMAEILNSGAADALIPGLIPLLNESIAQAIAEGINTDAAQSLDQSMVKSLILATDAEILAEAINESPDFVAGVLANLGPEAARAVAEGMNANPDTARAVARYLNGSTSRHIAEALNLNPAIIRPMVENLSPEVGTAIAEGLNQNTSDLSLQLMVNLKEAVGVELAAGLNSNPELMKNLLPSLNGYVGQEVAAGLNENSLNFSPSFLEAMLSATSPDFVQVVVEVMNTPPYNMDGCITQLILHLNGDTARAAAQGLSTNPTLVEYLLRNLDGEDTAHQMNANAEWTIALLQSLDPVKLADAVNGALSTPGGRAFVTGLLQNLDGSIVGRALSQNPQLAHAFIKRAGQLGLGTKLGQLLISADTGHPLGFLTTLMGRINSPTLMEIVVRAKENHNPDLPIPGHNMFECLWLYGESTSSLFPGAPPGLSWTRFIGDVEDVTSRR